MERRLNIPLYGCLRKEALRKDKYNSLRKFGHASNRISKVQPFFSFFRKEYQTIAIDKSETHSHQNGWLFIFFYPHGTARTIHKDIKQRRTIHYENLLMRPHMEWWQDHDWVQGHIFLLDESTEIVKEIILLGAHHLKRKIFSYPVRGLWRNG